MSGRNRSKCMINDVNSLLLDYDVTAYLSGHDHTLQHFMFLNDEKNQTVHYFISGTGSNVYKRPYQNFTNKYFHSNFYWNDERTKAGYLALSLNADTFQFQFHDARGKILNSGVISCSSKALKIRSESIKSFATNVNYNYLIFMNAILSIFIFFK